MPMKMPLVRLAGIVSAAMATALLAPLPAQAQDTLKLGLVAAMSGQSAKSGEAIVRGLSLAIDEVNAKGGLLGKKVEFLVRDDESTPAKGVLAARELVQREKVAALFGGLDTPVSIAIVPFANQTKTPFMGVWAAGTPLAGVLSSSRTRSSTFLPRRPPLALISSIASESPRTMASPDLADWPDMAATRPSLSVSWACTGAAARSAVARTAGSRPAGGARGIFMGMGDLSAVGDRCSRTGKSRARTYPRNLRETLILRFENAHLAGSRAPARAYCMQ